VLELTFDDGQTARQTVRFDIKRHGQVIGYRRHPGGPTPSVVRTAANAWRTRQKEKTILEWNIAKDAFDWNAATERALTFLAVDGVHATRPNGHPPMSRVTAERTDNEYERATRLTRNSVRRNMRLHDWGWPSGTEGVKSRIKRARAARRRFEAEDEKRRLRHARLLGVAPRPDSPFVAVIRICFDGEAAAACSRARTATWNEWGS
jgi:hypothetical protein